MAFYRTQKQRSIQVAYTKKHQQRVSKMQSKSNNNQCQEKVTPCFVITKVALDVGLKTIEEQLIKQGFKPEKRVKSSVTNQETRLIRVLTKNENQRKKQT